MGERSAAIGRTVRAGLGGWAPAMRTAWAALAVGALLSLTPSLLPGLAVLTPLFDLAGLILASGGVYRAAFGGLSGWRGLRLGREEGRLAIVFLLIGVILCTVAAVLLVIIGAVAVGVARSNAPAFDNGSLAAWRAALSGPGALPASIAPLLSFVLLIWLSLRLVLAPAATIDIGKVQVLSAFGCTRGGVLGLAVSSLLLLAPAAVLAVAVRGLAGVSLPHPAFAADLAGAALVYFYIIPVWTAALVDVYRHRAPSVPPPGTVRP